VLLHAALILIAQKFARKISATDHLVHSML